jgi:hypothetical protein
MLAGLQARFSNFNPKITPSADDEDGVYEVCIANISPLERRKRLRFGIFQFAISLVVLTALLITGADKVWRLSLFFLFAAGAVSCFQWLDKT